MENKRIDWKLSTHNGVQNNVFFFSYFCLLSKMNISESEVDLSWDVSISYLTIETIHWVAPWNLWWVISMVHDKLFLDRKYRGIWLFKSLANTIKRVGKASVKKKNDEGCIFWNEKSSRVFEKELRLRRNGSKKGQMTVRSRLPVLNRRFDV